jgi:hypothetical protein
MIKWITQYVPEGQLTPDIHGRWAIYGYIEVSTKILAQYKSFETVHCHVAVITLNKETAFSERYEAAYQSFKEGANHGFLGNSHFFHDDLDVVKRHVEHQFEIMTEVFKSL